MVLKDIEKKLDPAVFARISKSVLVNLDSVIEIKRPWHGDFEILLADLFGRTLLQLAAAARASCYVYTSIQEIDRLRAAMKFGFSRELSCRSVEFS